MVKKNFFHNVIRLRKGKPSESQVYWVIVILNSKKASSQKQIEQLGFFRHGPKRLFSMNYERLAYFLNKGFKLKTSVMKFIYWHTTLYKKNIKHIFNDNILNKKINNINFKKINIANYHAMFDEYNNLDVY